jgi:hypothetical protein
MRDLKSPVAIWAKGILFLLLGLAASAILVADSGSMRSAVLLAIAIWGFCRAYYFAFYVIEKYVDPEYRFSGLGSFIRYCMRRRREPHEVQESQPIHSTKRTDKPPDLTKSAHEDFKKTPAPFPPSSFSSLPSVRKTEGNNENDERRREI